MLTIQRFTHAAHHGTKASDLIVYIFESPVNRRHSQIPPSAEYRCGFLLDGIQHWEYVESVPTRTETCNRCGKK